MISGHVPEPGRRSWWCGDPRTGILLAVGWTNWAGDERCSPAVLVRPLSVEELGTAVRDAGGWTVRVAGAGHSFGDLVATDGVLLQLDGLADVLTVDRDAGLVRVGAGIRLHALNAALDALGLALPNLGDIDRQTVAGAISTATHGTGARLGNLATQVEELELVLADGSTLRCAPGSDELRAARVGLGALGVLATVTLRVVPAFRLRAEDRAHPLDETLARLDELVAGSDHFEFYVFPHSDRALTRTNTRTDAPAAPRGRLRRLLDEELVPNDLLGAVCRLGRRFPATIPRLNRQVAAAFTANVRTDASHRVFAGPRRVRFTEMEWALPRTGCVPVLRAALRAAERHAVNLPIEVRFTAADEESFLSPSWCRDTAYVAVHAFAGMPWEPYFRDVQAAALEHDGRPHWGKRHLLDAAALAPRYPAWDRFQAVRDRLDPDRRFTNAHVARVLGD